jgi:membrane-bound metal-dependent hydrolase YbcI (DUF457 family)
MWPWEHLAFGYILYSVTVRLLRVGPVTRRSAVWLAVATQLPDLVDKPLAWTVPLLPGGRSLAHSLFVAVPLVSLALWVAYSRDRLTVGVAFVVGYLSHLAGDVLYQVVVGDGLRPTFLLWPLLPPSSLDVAATGTVGHVGVLFAAFLARVHSPGGLLYIGLQTALVGAAVTLWLVDRRGVETTPR